MSKVASTPRETAVRESIFYNTQHGPLPALLLGLTLLTGAVDAISLLSLGRVFVANMTGNIVFIGLGLAHAPGFALGASTVALAGFLIGAALGGWLHDRYDSDRGKLFAISCSTELLLVLASLVIALCLSHPTVGVGRYYLSAILATMMGIQNAVARGLAVPDMTTTVLTMTLTGIAADIRHQNGLLSIQLGRRFLAVGAMLVGALAGGEFVMRRSVAAALILATLVMLAVAIGALAAIRHESSGWRAVD